MVPGFQEFMLPMLRLLGNGEVVRTHELHEELSRILGLSLDDRAERLPSGRSTKLYNRVQWAKYYLQRAGLVDSKGRGRFAISEEGRKVIASNPARIDIAFLRRYPSFVEFESKQADVNSSVRHPSGGATVGAAEESPEETLERTWRQLRSQAAEELVDRVKTASPQFFEELVVRLLVAMGYGGSYADAASVVGKSGDEGIDGVIKADRLGLDVLYVQAKRWQNVVGRPTVQGFAGSLEGKRARKGVLITTSSFTGDARAYVDQIEKQIVLIDGQELGELMIEFGIGVTQDRDYSLPRIDLDYFDEA